MELTIGDRLALIHQILLMQASVVERLMMRDMAKRIEITSEEVIKSRLTYNSGFPTWDKDLAGKHFDFTDAEMALLRKKVAQLDTAETVTELATDVCRKIQDAKK